MRPSRQLALPARPAIPRHRGSRPLRLLGVLAALVAACFKPSYEQPRCGPDQACPEGYTCANEFCLRPEDPDGGPIDAPPGTPGVVQWARALSGVTPVGVLERGDALTVTGYFAAPIELGGGVVTPIGTSSAVVGLATADAGYLSAYTFGGAGEAYAFPGAVDRSGGAPAPILQGASYGEVDLGRGAVGGGGGSAADGFVGHYGDGAPTWVTRLVGPGEDKLVGSALQAGNLYVLGWFEGAPTFDDVALVSSAGSRDILFARMKPSTGAIDVTRVLGSNGRDEATAITAAGAELAATGFFAGTLAFSGALSLTSAQGSLDVWVSKLSLAGDARWAVAFGGPGDDRGGPLVSDAAGDLYLAGTFITSITLGASTLTSRGGADVFLAKLRGSDGAVVWATQLGSPGEDSVTSLALDGAGHVVLAATIAGELEAGGPAFGGLDACFASYDAAGAQRWLKVLGTAEDDRGWSVAAGAGAVYAGLSVASPLPNLGVPVTGPGADDYTGLLLKIVP